MGGERISGLAPLAYVIVRYAGSDAQSLSVWYNRNRHATVSGEGTNNPRMGDGSDETGIQNNPRRGTDQMRRVFITAALAVTLLALAALPANAVIHEQVAAYCSGGDVGVIDGGGNLEPSALNDMTSPAFAAPVLNNGVVVITSGDPDAEIGTKKNSDPLVVHPASKYPVGTDVLINGAPQDLGDPVHNSTHCPAVDTNLP